MTMYAARTQAAEGGGLTAARAVAGVCNFYVEEEWGNDYPLKVEVFEYEYEDRYGNPDVQTLTPLEEFAEQIVEVEIDPAGVEKFVRLHQELEEELSIAENEEDWRIDYGDDDITYLTIHEGGVVDMNEHWDKAQESLEEVKEWGGDCHIKEVEGEVELGLKEVDN